MAIINTSQAFWHILFYFRYGWFQLRERFRDLGGSIGYLLLYPFFIWILTQIWQRFNADQGNYLRQEIILYVSITELLFMTFLRSPFMQRSNADFSITLARPRSWLGMTFCGQFGTVIAGRILYALIAGLMLPFFGIPFELIIKAFFRLGILLPFLGIIEALMSSVFISAQLLWHETRYLYLPLSKIFLALGGVFGPLVDYGEPGRSIFLKLPASDLFFQVGHFCVKGEFYQMTPLQWGGRVLIWFFVFFLWNLVFFKFARQRHQSLGG